MPRRIQVHNKLPDFHLIAMVTVF